MAAALAEAAAGGGELVRAFDCFIRAFDWKERGNVPVSRRLLERVGGGGSVGVRLQNIVGTGVRMNNRFREAHKSRLPGFFIESVSTF